MVRCYLATLHWLGHPVKQGNHETWDGVTAPNTTRKEVWVNAGDSACVGNCPPDSTECWDWSHHFLPRSSDVWHHRKKRIVVQSIKKSINNQSVSISQSFDNLLLFWLENKLNGQIVFLLTQHEKMGQRKTNALLWRGQDPWSSLFRCQYHKKGWIKLRSKTLDVTI